MVDPPQPEGASPQEIDGHGPYGSPETPDAAHQDIRQAKNHIPLGNPIEPYRTGPDHSRILVEQGEQFRCPASNQDSLSDAQHKGQTQADPDHPIHPFPFPGPQVLADEGHPGLMEGIHGDVQEILDAGTGAVGRHHHAAKEIDGSLDHHIGQAEEHGLDCGRDTDPGYFLQGFPIQQEPMPMVAERAGFPSQTAEHQGR